MRTAYLIQAHRDPEQLLRLVRTIRKSSPSSIIHVSYDKRGPAPDWAPFHKLGQVEVALDDGGYGDFTHVERYLRAVESLRRFPGDVDWVINITGSCYPLRPLAHVEAELAASEADAYLEHFEVFGTDSPWPHRRAASRYLFAHRKVATLSETAQRRVRPIQALNRIQPLGRVHVSYGLTLGVRRGWRLGRETGLWGGSAYASLRLECAMHVVREIRGNGRLREQFGRALSPEEVIIQTVLCNSGRFRLINDARRYFDFSATAYNHPRTLGAEDLPAALASGADFGRKFDLRHDPEVFDILDGIVLERSAR